MTLELMMTVTMVTAMTVAGYWEPYPVCALQNSLSASWEDDGVLKKQKLRLVMPLAPKHQAGEMDLLTPCPVLKCQVGCYRERGI